jgi:hypothetical protein
VDFTRCEIHHRVTVTCTRNPVARLFRWKRNSPTYSHTGRQSARTTRTQTSFSVSPEKRGTAILAECRSHQVGPCAATYNLTLARLTGGKRPFSMKRVQPAHCLHAPFSICRTRSSHARISPILLLMRFTCRLAARRLRAVERSIATRPSLEIRSHLVANFFASLVSSAADFLSRASSLRMLSLGRVGLGIESSRGSILPRGWHSAPKAI